MTETWLVAHDFSPCSDAATMEAARLLAPMKGTLRVLHVHAPVPLRREEPWGELTYSLENVIRKQLARIADAARSAHPGIQVELAVTTGEPVHAVLAEAERSGADHIVVGTHGKTGLAHLLLGSVAEQVVRQAKVPVLVVRERGAA